MDHAEFSSMTADALDAIQLRGHEWRSRLLDNSEILALGNNGDRWTFKLRLQNTSEQRLHDEMAAVSETPKAKPQRIDKKMVAALEKSQGSDAFEESARKGRAMTRLLGANAGASEAAEASEKSVESDWVIKNPLAVLTLHKGAMNHTDFCMVLGGALDAICSGDGDAHEWVSNQCSNGDVFYMDWINQVWYLEVASHAKGNKMKGGAGRGGHGQGFRDAGKAKGSHASGKRC